MCMHPLRIQVSEHEDAKTLVGLQTLQRLQTDLEHHSHVANTEALL
jgi:hypothetical protein